MHPEEVVLGCHYRPSEACSLWAPLFLGCGLHDAEDLSPRYLRPVLVEGLHLSHPDRYDGVDPRRREGVLAEGQVSGPKLTRHPPALVLAQGYEGVEVDVHLELLAASDDDLEVVEDPGW